MAAGDLSVIEVRLAAPQHGPVVADGGGGAAGVQTEGAPGDQHVRLIIGDLFRRLG